MVGCGSFAELAAKPIAQYLTPASQAYWEYYFQARASGNAVPLEFELEAVRTDGTQRMLRVCISSEVLDRRTCELSTFVDVTDQRRAERERLAIERRLLDAQKLESLGVLAGGIAHDFNNLLMAVLGNLDMALADTPASSPAQASIRQAMQSSRRASDLTRELLAYSGHSHFVFCQLDLNNVVRENAELLRSSVPRTIALAPSLATERVWIEADPAQIQQVVMNLITNASEAIGERPGVVTLRTVHLDVSEEQLRQSRIEERPEPGRFACLEVTDTGCGMDEETLGRLFDPFFTTKATGRGLGMSAVLGIVRGHRGAILIDTVPERGTTVRVFFPAAAAGTVVPEAGSEALPQAAVAPRFSGTALVVDDDDAVRQLCITYLRRLGFETLAAADGEQALLLFRRCAGDIRLVLLDLTMPHKDGVATYHELKQLRPDVRVILCSGYSERETARRFQDEGLNYFLQKPYKLRQLRSMIEHILREPPC
jgi:signal transduction histidine kinase/CheY-like chemotaxis protein